MYELAASIANVSARTKLAKGCFLFKKNPFPVQTTKETLSVQALAALVSAARQKTRKKRFERGKELRARRRRSSLPRSKRFLRGSAGTKCSLSSLPRRVWCFFSVLFFVLLVHFFGRPLASPISSFSIGVHWS